MACKQQSANSIGSEDTRRALGAVKLLRNMGLSKDEAHRLVVRLGYEYRRTRVTTEPPRPPAEIPVDSSGTEVPPDWYWQEPVDRVRFAAIDRPRGNMGVQQVTRNIYHRSEAVRVYVLRRANGRCEGCGQPAPFKTSDGRYYLEAHHTTRLSDEGPDDPQWVIAVCPNCHRRVHFSEDRDTYGELLSSKASSIESQTHVEQNP